MRPPIKNYLHYCQLVIVKVKANLQAEASKNYLSYCWWVFEPLLQMMVYYLVFGVLLQRGTEDFVVYLLCGLIPWLWFSRSVSNSMFSIVQGKGLMMQVHLPKLIFPAIVVCQDLVKQSVVMSLLLVFLCLYGVDVSYYWLALPVIMVVEILLIGVCSLVVAAVIPFLPDLSYLVRTGLMMLMFCSGVFYSVEIIPLEYRDLFFLNPIAGLLREYRSILLYGQWPDWQFLLNVSGLAGLLLMLEVRLIRRFEYIYPRVVI